MATPPPPKLRVSPYPCRNVNTSTAATVSHKRRQSLRKMWTIWLMGGLRYWNLTARLRQRDKDGTQGHRLNRQISTCWEHRPDLLLRLVFRVVSDDKANHSAGGLRLQPRRRPWRWW